MVSPSLLYRVGGYDGGHDDGAADGGLLPLRGGVQHQPGKIVFSTYDYRDRRRCKELRVTYLGAQVLLPRARDLRQRDLYQTDLLRLHRGEGQSGEGRSQIICSLLLCCCLKACTNSGGAPPSQGRRYQDSLSREAADGVPQADERDSRGREVNQLGHTSEMQGHVHTQQGRQ